MVLWLVFCVFGESAKVLKSFFLSFLGICGVVYSCLFGFRRFRCFVVFVCVCVFFFCQVLFLFVLVLFLFCCWIAVGVVFFWGVCVFCYCFFLGFCFVLFFKGQVRWPKGPPHLALNPPYFCFVFFLLGGGGCLFFVFCFCLEGLRVRWGGSKGHLTWP